MPRWFSIETVGCFYKRLLELCFAGAPGVCLVPAVPPDAQKVEKGLGASAGAGPRALPLSL